MFERFTDRARRVLVLAQEEARLLGHGFIDTEHLLLGLLGEGRGVASRALHQSGVTLEGARARIEQLEGPPRPLLEGSSPPFTPRAKKVLELSLREALQLGHSHIDTEHLLLGILRQGEGMAVEVLVSSGVDLGQLRSAVLAMAGPGQGAGHVRRGELRPPGPRIVFVREKGFTAALRALCGHDEPFTTLVVLSNGEVRWGALVAVEGDHLVMRKVEAPGEGEGNAASDAGAGAAGAAGAEGADDGEQFTVDLARINELHLY